MVLREILHELREIRKELQIIRNEKESHPEIVLDERTISQAVRKLERNIEIKTEGVTQEENEKIHSMLRLLNRRRRHEGKERITYEIKTENKTCVTR